MTLDDVINYFGTSYQLQKQINMAHQNWANWKKIGYIPIMTQLKIEKLTKGKLKADLAHVLKKD